MAVPCVFMRTGEWLAFSISSRNAFSAGTEANQHSAIYTFPVILGESLQHRTMGTKIPLNHSSCKSIPVIICPSHVSCETEKCTFYICMPILTLKRSKRTCHSSILAQCLGHEFRARASIYFPAPPCFLPLAASCHAKGSATSPSDVAKAEVIKALEISTSVSPGSLL